MGGWCTYGLDKVSLDLGLDLVNALALSKALVSQEHDTEDGVPEELVNAHL